jgi:DNA-binding Lrp family transcriptional regulator
LWFTLQARTPEEIESTLSGLSSRFGIEFHSLPAVRIFKLGSLADSVQRTAYSVQISKTKVVELNNMQKEMLIKLQDDMELVEEPFAHLCSEDLNEQDVLAIVTELVDKGVIRRIGAVVDYRKLGFAANALFVCEVQLRKVCRAGEALARLPIVSHCYERATFESWPYNLYAMMHGRTMSEIQLAVGEFIKSENISAYEFLPTKAELKKQPVRYSLP